MRQIDADYLRDIVVLAEYSGDSLGDRCIIKWFRRLIETAPTVGDDGTNEAEQAPVARIVEAQKPTKSFSALMTTVHLIRFLFALLAVAFVAGGWRGKEVILIMYLLVSAVTHLSDFIDSL